MVLTLFSLTKKKVLLIYPGVLKAFVPVSEENIRTLSAVLNSNTFEFAVRVCLAISCIFCLLCSKIWLCDLSSVFRREVVIYFADVKSLDVHQCISMINRICCVLTLCSILVDDAVNQRYAELRKDLKVADKEDKDLDRKRRKGKRIKEKMKYKRGREEQEEEDEELSSSDAENPGDRVDKKSKIYFDSDDEDGDRKGDIAKEGIAADAISLAEQEELALKLLNSMHS